MYYSLSNSLSAAKAYLSLGFSLLPIHSVNANGCTCGKTDCKSIGKHPRTMNGVKDATQDVERIATFFADSLTNIAVATGELSGIFVLDVDDINDLTSLENVHGRLPSTWKVQTGSGGVHYYFRFDERCKPIRNAVKFHGSLDVRTSGGYVLLPPSLHASGQRYRWLAAPDECELASAPDWLLNVIGKEEKTEPLSVERAKTLNERAMLYLRKVPSAVSGENGHSTTYSVVCRLVELFGELSDDELLDALDDWNDRCLPPWTERELRHKINDARRKVVTQDSSNEESNVGKPVPVTDWPVIDNAAFYGLAGEIVQRIEPQSETDNVALLLTFLTAFGCTVGRNPHFLVEGGKQHVNLYACLVGQSAKARKGTSLQRIRDVFQLTSARSVSGLSTGEGLIHAVRDGETEEKNGKFVSQGGIEDKRLWIVESEFARTLKVIRRDGNTLSPVIRDAWDTGELSSLTKGTPLQASGAHLAITAHITCEELSKALDETEAFNGFANRFLWALVKRSKLLPDGGDCIALDDLRQRLRSTLDKGKAIQRLTRSEDCQQRWNEVYAELASDSDDRKGLWDAATSRAEAQVLRLSMLYALLDCNPRIEVSHLEAALALWRYCDESARIIFSNRDSSISKLETTILTTVKNRPGILRSELRLSVSHTVKTELFNAAVNRLLNRGAIVCVPVYESRQAERYYLGCGLGNGKLGNRPMTMNTLNSGFPISQFPNVPTEAVASQEPTSPTSLIPNFPSSQTASVKGMTLTEFFDWRNANSVNFVRRNDGTIWVTDDKVPLLTPILEQTLHDQQGVLAMLIGSGTNLPTTQDVDDVHPEGRSFYEELVKEFRDIPADENWFDEMRRLHGMNTV